MSAIRVQIHLKYFSEENSAKKLHNFWYAFDPSKWATVKDILEDIRLHYLAGHEEYEEQAWIVHLDDCQVLPFTSSRILRDNDQLTLMPLDRYKVHRKSFQDSTSLNLSLSTIAADPPIVASEKHRKRQRLESNEENISSESTITIIPTVEKIDQPSQQKKSKTDSTENRVSIPCIIQTKPQSPPPPPKVQQIPSAPVVEKEKDSELPLSLPSTNGRIKELKSKTPAWKAQPPAAKGNVQEKLHIRFDSDSDDDPKPQTPAKTVEEKLTEPPSPTLPPLVNGSNSSVRIHYVPTPVSAEPIKSATEDKTPKKTIDLLFEMKQHKTIEEKQAKKIQQQFGRKRAQHRKRAIAYLSMANFVDQAFGVDKNELEKQISSNGHHSSSSSSSPQTLPISFSKLGRLPLVAEAVDNNDKIYDLYPPMTQCPPVQTRLAFKLLELSEDFCPKMSEYKEGTVTDVNEATGEVTIQLDKPLQSVFDQPSKFYAPTDEVPVDEECATVIVPFSDLNSVRLLPA